MADKFTIIRNGLVLTLNREKAAGYYPILIKNDKIAEIDTKLTLSEKTVREKYPSAKIIDARDKLIMPAFYNSYANSSYTLSKFFFKKTKYDNIGYNVSLRLLDSYFNSETGADEKFELLCYNHKKNLFNGVSFINETSQYLNLELITEYLSDKWTNQKLYFTTYNNDVSSYLTQNSVPHSYGIKFEEDINNYSLNTIKKSLQKPFVRLFLEVARVSQGLEVIKDVFGKPLLKVLQGNDLLSERVILANPVHISQGDIDLLKSRNVNVLFSPTDMLKLARKNVDFTDYINNGINLIIGTGILGNDILTELKTFTRMSYKSDISYESILKMATLFPAEVFGFGSISGSIDRNKNADISFFDLKDIRNFLNVPETDPEKISEFVIENLTSKDVTDLMIDGEFVYREKTLLENEDETNKSKIDSLIRKVYDAGKYFDFKERSLMKKRVDDITMKKTESTQGSLESIEGFDPSGDFADDGDFKVIGIKTAEHKQAEEEEEYLSGFMLSEVRSTEEGLSIFGSYEDIKTVKVRQPEESDPGNKVAVKTEFKETKESSTQKLPEEKIKAAPKKSTFKFGFSEDDEK
jgi:5-methylthioadenosine/S-adenosylhomocysteine deaminase